MELLYSERLTKYYVEKYWEYKLSQSYRIIKEFDNGYHFLKKRTDGWYIGAYKGCRWDGASCWFDHRVILKGSLGHDILCWLIEDGCIAEKENNKIDKELEIIVLASNKSYPWWMGGKPVLHIRARLIRRGTNLKNQKKGKEYKVYKLP